MAPERGEPVQSVPSVEALAEQGLRCDRYSQARNRVAADCQVTLLELENIEAFIQDRGLPLTPGIPRRNIVTRGVRLNELFGERFRVGAATFEGLGLCEPCAVFAKVTHREALKFFVRKGGMRARIIEGGEVRVGDFVGEDAWRFVRADRRAQRAAAFRSAVPGWLSASVATVADLSTRPLDAMT